MRNEKHRKQNFGPHAIPVGGVMHIKKKKQSAATSCPFTRRSFRLKLWIEDVVSFLFYGLLEKWA